MVSSKTKMNFSFLSDEVIDIQTSLRSNLSQKLSAQYRNKDTNSENVFSSPIIENKSVHPTGDRSLCVRALRTPSRY